LFFLRSGWSKDFTSQSGNNIRILTVFVISTINYEGISEFYLFKFNIRIHAFDKLQQYFGFCHIMRFPKK
jgi:hypothetical protein